jgi:hypothetical protein
LGWRCTPARELKHIDAFNPTTSKRIMDFLRRGATREGVLRRCEIVKAKFPSKADYIDGELISTMRFWADCYQVWCTSFRLRAAALMEGLNHTLKSRLERNPLALHLFPQYIREQMGRRSVNVERRRDATDTLPALKKTARESGHFGNLVDVLEVAVNDAGQDILM